MNLFGKLGGREWMTLRQKLGVPMMAGGEAPREEGGEKRHSSGFGFTYTWLSMRLVDFPKVQRFFFMQGPEKLHFKGAKFVESHSFDSEITVWGHFEKEEEEDTFGASINPSRVSISHNENNIYDAK